MIGEILAPAGGRHRRRCPRRRRVLRRPDGAGRRAAARGGADAAVVGRAADRRRAGERAHVERLDDAARGLRPLPRAPDPGGGGAARAAALDDATIERLDIPAFLRKQAD